MTVTALREEVARRHKPVNVCGHRKCDRPATEGHDVLSWFVESASQIPQHYEVCSKHGDEYFGGVFDKHASRRVKKDLVRSDLQHQLDPLATTVQERRRGTTLALYWEAEVPEELGGGREDVVARRAHDQVVAELREDRDRLRERAERLERDLDATIAAVEGPMFVCKHHGLIPESATARHRQERVCWVARGRVGGASYYCGAPVRPVGGSSVPVPWWELPPWDMPPIAERVHASADGWSFRLPLLWEGDQA